MADRGRKGCYGISNNLQPRKSIRWFNGPMEKKLMENEHKPDWSKIPIVRLYNRLQEEMCELLDVLYTAGLIGTEVPYLNNDDDEPTIEELIIQECADVANFAMMIADQVKRKMK